MPTSTFGAPLESVEGTTKSLSTTAGYLAVKPGWEQVKMYCASQWRMAISPKLLHVLYYDTSATTYTDYVTNATDGSSSTHVPLDAMATGDYLYLGTTDPVLGFYIDMGTNVNDQTATLDMEYCSTAVDQGVSIAFTDFSGSDSDGTSSGGVTLAQDGVYTWGTLPTTGTWVTSYLGSWEDREPYGKCYWTRFKPSATLGTTVDLNEIIPVYQNTNYGYFEAGVEYAWTINTMKTGGFVLVATSGTPTLDITWMKHT